MKKSKQIKLLKEQNEQLLGEVLRLKLENAIQRRALIETMKKLTRAEAGHDDDYLEEVWEAGKNEETE